MKRGYLLPGGCKDLIDVLKPNAQPAPALRKPSPPVHFPPITGELTVPAWMTVSELAEVLNQKPFQIIADLMEIRVLATISDQLDFGMISRVMRKHGFIAKKAG